MQILGIPRSHFWESKPLSDVQSAFVKNLVQHEVARRAIKLFFLFVSKKELKIS
jgi:hypothetical protein